MTTIYFNPKISPELKQDYFHSHTDQFQNIFKQFISVNINNIELTALFTEWKKLV